MDDPIHEAETRVERIEKVLLDQLEVGVEEIRGSWEGVTEEEERDAIGAMRQRHPENWVKQAFADVWEEQVNREYLR